MKPISNFPLLFAPRTIGQKPVKHLHPVRKNCGVQGGCCSDKYVYQLMYGKDYSAIRKIDPTTWKTVQVSDRIYVGHGNDMCWNPHSNEIIAAHNSPEKNRLSIFDADTLELKEQKDIDIGIYAIDYNKSSRVYYVCEVGGHRLARLSQDFEIEEIFSLNVQGHTRQGITFYDNKLYMALYNPNVIKVFDTRGKHLRTYPLPLSVGEPENLFVYEGTFYITYNKKNYRGGIIYHLNTIK